MLFRWFKCSLTAVLDSYNYYADWLILYIYVMFWQSHPPSGNFSDKMDMVSDGEGFEGNYTVVEYSI